MTKADYGLDAPSVTKKLFIFGILSALLSLFLLIAFSTRVILFVFGIVCAFTGVCLVATGFLMVFSSRFGKIKEREKLLDLLGLHGDERVLDIGCGRGLYLIGAAKRLTNGGKAIGIDIWQNKDLSDNSQQNTLDNAVSENVLERVIVKTADMRRIPFTDSSFDVVLSCLAIHTIYDRAERQKALSEIVRVLKPDGKLCIIDMRYTKEYISFFEEKGISIQQTSRLKLVFPKSVAIIGIKK